MTTPRDPRGVAASQEGARPSPQTSLAALLLADSRLPVGGYTVSGGLESALLGGMPARDVPAFIAMRLATVARIEAGTAVVAAAAVRRVAVVGADAVDADDAGASDVAGMAGDDRGDRVGSSDEADIVAARRGVRATVGAEDVAWAWAARTPVAAVREASVAQGRAMLRLVRRLRPHGSAAAWLEGLPRALTSRPVVLGALAGELGLDRAAVARIVGYDDVQSVAAAALKLEPLDPMEAVVWALDAADDLDDLVTACAHLTAPHDIPAHSTPQLEAWHAAHATTERKLFRV